jgi:peroxiredoxin
MKRKAKPNSHFYRAIILTVVVFLNYIHTAAFEDSTRHHSPLHFSRKESPQEQIRRAEDLAQHGAGRKGVALLRRLLTAEPMNAAAHVQYVHIKTFHLGAYDAVRAEYDHLSSSDPANPLYRMALLLGAGPMIPDRIQRQWYEGIASRFPGSAWGHYARAKLMVDNPQGAAAELTQCIAAGITQPEPYEMLYSLQINKLQDMNAAKATAAKMSSQWQTRQAGLLHGWQLRLAEIRGNEPAQKALKSELMFLASTAGDLDTLAAIYQGLNDLFSDAQSAAQVQTRIRQIDRDWYPDRDWTFVLVQNDGNGFPRQVALCCSAVKQLFSAYFVGDDLAPAVRIGKLENILGQMPERDVRWYIYTRLLASAEQLGDQSRIVRYADGLRRMDPRGSAWQAKIALALAERKMDLVTAARYARFAEQQTRHLEVPPKPPNTDADWLHDLVTADWLKKNFAEKRALALDAYGWVLCRQGNYQAAEQKLRASLSIARSEKQLLHLAAALKGLNRKEEAADMEMQAKREYAESIRRAMLNEPAPDFELASIDGRKVRLSDLKGNVVMLYFFATWCGACIKEGPYILKLSQTHNNDGFKILGISLDQESDRQKTVDFAGEMKNSFPVLFDNGAAKSYQVENLPMSMIFIDREGKLRYRHSGFSDDTPGELDVVIDILLQKKTSQQSKNIH